MDKKGNKYFEINNAHVRFIIFNNLGRPASVCLEYLYLFLFGHISDIYLFIYFDPMKPV